MNCCTNCFEDSEVKAIIESNRVLGDCGFCGSENVSVFDIEKNHRLSELFDDLLDIYTPLASLPSSFASDNTDLLKNTLATKWSIFNLEPSKISRLIKELCPNRYLDQPELFDSPVGVLESADCDYLKENAILKSHNWTDFLDVVKHKNRFHCDYINKDILEIFLHCARKSYKKGSTFFRARICSNAKGFSKDEMGAPPQNFASPGRVNPEGVSILYLSSSEETTLYEVRAGVYDYVTIGNFKLKEDIEIIDMTAIDKISPFIGITNRFDLTQYAVNIDHLRMISSEISKPLRRQDSHLDYVPTQYISDFIRSKGYQGIEFRSAMCTHGENIAIFDKSLLSCTKVKSFSVKSVAYTYSDAN